MYSYKTFLQLIQVNQNKQSTSTFVVLNITLQVLQLISLLNNIANDKKYLYGRNIDHKPIPVRE